MELFIVVVLAAIQCLVGYLGFHLTVSPAATDHQRQLYKGAFIGLGLLGILATVGQWWYASRAAAELTGSISQVREQTKQPPNVTVNVPQPLVQLLPAPAATSQSPAAQLSAPKSTAAVSPEKTPLLKPPSPFNVRVKFDIDYGQIYMTLSELQKQGLDLLEAATKVDSDVYKAQVVEWATKIANHLIDARQMTDELEMNSDVGVPSHATPANVPEGNRGLYHNVWFRVYRLQEFLRRVEKEWLKNVVFGR
jgi:hypothetical protein